MHLAELATMVAGIPAGDGTVDPVFMDNLHWVVAAMMVVLVVTGSSFT